MIIEKTFYNQPKLESEEMIKVEFLGPIARPAIELDVSDLRELSTMLKEDETIAPWLSKCAVALNDAMISELDTPLKDGDRVTILPPVCGG